MIFDRIFDALRLIGQVITVGLTIIVIVVVGHDTWQWIKPLGPMVVPGEYYTFSAQQLEDGRLQHCIIQSGDTIKPVKWIDDDLVITVEAGSEKRPISSTLCPVSARITMSSDAWGSLQQTTFMEKSAETMLEAHRVKLERERERALAHESAVTAALANP